jgi:hypothetical protein
MVNPATTLNLNTHVNEFARLSPKDELISLQGQERWYNVALRIAPIAFITLSITAIWLASSSGIGLGMVAIAGSFFFFQEIYVRYVDSSLRESRDKSMLDRQICEIALNQYESLHSEEHWRATSSILSEGGMPYRMDTQFGTSTNEKEIFPLLTPLYSRYKAMATIATKAESTITVRQEILTRLQSEITTEEEQGTLQLADFRQKELQIAELKAEIHHLEESHNVYAGTYGLAESKIASAYYRHLLKNPTDKRHVGDFGTITRQNLFYRNTTNDQCYFFTNAGRRIDKEFFLRSSISEIQDRLFSD